MKRYEDDHNLVNHSESTKLLLLEPGERVRLRDLKGGRLAYSDYSGEEFGYELEVPPHHSVEVLQWGR